MARIARVVVPGFPHHITQRGNRRLPVFFDESDYHAYKTLLAQWCRKAQVQVWAYCLMTNHVHLILVPATADGLRAALGEAHRRYTRRVNFREGWRGHLWQARFASYVMDERHLIAAARYVELNPVQAGMVADPASYPWSSAGAHLTRRDDDLVQVAPLLQRVPDWRGLLESGLTPAERTEIERHGRTGRPLGSDRFLTTLEAALGRALGPRRAGRKPKAAAGK
ncbi:MAG: transposase [Candidatus Omnitrophica bacterium]|nr:transposase [Candidatus Omnitrophota bacterium]